MAELLPASPAWRNSALHAAAGVVVAVVGIEILPAAIDVLDGWEIAVAFMCGGLVYIGADAMIQRTGNAAAARMWMIYLAVATDLLGDGLMIGAATTIDSSLGLVLAAGQVLADIPEGAAAIMTVRRHGVARRRRIALSVSFAVPAVGGAAASYLLLRGRPEAWQLAALVGTAGMFTVAVFEDMIREAHESSEDSRLSTVALLVGFAGFALVSAGLG